jgi:medium-chain acyl-[acyl-carrier-protein] hydrolase
MKERFCSEFYIDYQGVDENLCTSFPRLMGYIQETSLLHTENSGYSMSWFAENEKAFILTNWEIECIKLPKWGDKIKIYTWPSFFKGILATRSFIAFDEDEHVLLKADSQWIYTDLIKKKPLKIQEDMVKNYGAVYPGHFEKESFPCLEGYSLVNSSMEKVKRSDTDSNHHANNVSYIRWITDSIADEIYNSRSLNKISIKYKKECKLNDNIVIENYAKDDSFLDFVTIVREPEDKDAVHCIARSLWNKIN